MSKAFTKFANYNPTSPGLLGPLPSCGNCLRDERLDVDAQIWVDFDAPLLSGSQVVIFHESANGPAALGKWLQYVPTPELWWGVAYATRDADSLAAVRLDNPRFRVAGVAAVVARLETMRETPRAEMGDGYGDTPGASDYFAEGRNAIAYWRDHGYPPLKRFEFATPPENIAVIRQIWGSTTPPNPVPRFPLILAAECLP